MSLETQQRAVEQLPLSSLVLSSKNMRKSKVLEKEFLNSIRENGVVQALTVTPGDGKFEVAAGRRRLLALQQLAKSKLIPKDHPIPCVLCTKEEALTLSMVENLHRKAPHDAEIYRSIQDLLNDGVKKLDVCNKLQITSMQYDQFLRLANLHKRIFKAYAADDLSEAQVKAFAATDDKKKQLSVWEQSGFSNSISTHQIHNAMRAGLTTRDPIVKCIGIEAYTKAGGTSTHDLFSDVHVVHDEDIVLRLAKEALDRELEQIKLNEPEWKWYTTLLPTEDEEKLGIKNTLYGKFRKRTPEQKSQLKVISDKLEVLDDIEEDAWSDEFQKQYEDLEEQKDDLHELISQQNEYFTKKEMKSAGLLVTIDFHGRINCRRGLQTKEDIKEVKSKKGPASETEADSEEAPESADYSQALKSDVKMYLRSMKQAQLIKNPHLSIELLNYSLLVSVFELGYSPKPIDAKITRSHNDTSLEDYADSPAFKVIQDAYNNLELEWIEIEGHEERIEAYISLPETAKTQLLSYASAIALESDLDNYIRRETELEVSDFWTPNARNYFTRVPKNILLRDLEEITGEQPDKEDAKSTKKLLAEKLAQFIQTNKSTWIPAIFK